MSEISIAIADDNLQTLSLLNDILEGEEDFHVDVYKRQGIYRCGSFGRWCM